MTPQAARTHTAQQTHVDDDLDTYIRESVDQSPAFRAAFEDAEARQRLLDTLVSCRKAQDLTQRDLATRMGVGQSTVGGFETEDADPRLGTLQRYARAVGGRLRVSVVTASHTDWLRSEPTSYTEAASSLLAPRIIEKGVAARWPQGSGWLRSA